MQRIKKSSLHIDCPIFSKYEQKINELTPSIFGDKLLSEKVGSAQELLKIINYLSRCPQYDGMREDCFNCNFTLNLRKEMARLIVEAAQTAY
jgi:hypothetical protein